MFSNKKNRLAGGQKSLRFRIATFFILAFSFIVLPVFLIIFKNFQQSLEHNFDANLYNYTTEIAESLDWTFFGRIEIGRKQLRASKKALPFNLGKASLQVVTSDGTRLAAIGSKKLPVTPIDLSSWGRKEPVLRSTYFGKNKYRMINFPVERRTGSLKLILQVAVPVEFLEKQINQQKQILYYVLPGLMLIIFLAGYFFSAAVLAPLNQIVAKTKDMTASDLSTRLDVGDSSHELNELAKTLNELFDRLQIAFESQEEFVSNASHQLKTPLAILKGEIDVYQQKDNRTADETKALVSKLSIELDHLTKLVNELLVLASLDVTQGDLEFKKLHLDEVVFEAISRIKPMAEKNKIPIEMHLDTKSKGFVIQGDQMLLETMLQTLLENAIKHSEVGKRVNIVLSSDAQFCSVKVHNWGSVVPEDEKNKIFSRFYRAQNQKKSTQQGIGLGLAISRQIALRHGGDVQVQSSLTEGTTFQVDIKKL